VQLQCSNLDFRLDGGMARVIPDHIRPTAHGATTNSSQAEPMFGFWIRFPRLAVSVSGSVLLAGGFYTEILGSRSSVSFLSSAATDLCCWRNLARGFLFLWPERQPVFTLKLLHSLFISGAHPSVFARPIRY
jgi:hypothetical protein